jgi:hypothetical protein
MVGGNVVAGENYLFMYNGTNFTSTIPPIPQQPPQLVFYVRPDGNDNNSGLANTPAAAFLTIPGAISNIKARYISQNTITIRVADGTYTSGAFDNSSYIAGWSIIGNTTNPGNCVINATSTVGGSYVSGSSPGYCVMVQVTAYMTVQGFTFESYYSNAGANGGGILNLLNNYYTTPTSGTVVIGAASGAVIGLGGSNQYTGSSSPAAALFSAALSAFLQIGNTNIYSSEPCSFNLIGTPTFLNGTGLATSSGAISCVDQVTTFTGVIPTGPQYQSATAGGISFGSSAGAFPGSSPGIVTAPGWKSP